MQAVNFEGCCDFHCWVIKYNRLSIFKKIYRKDSLKDSWCIVPLLWDHNHNDADSVIGCATLEHRDEGVYAYCKLFDKPNIDTTKTFLKTKGSVSLSPFVVNVKYDHYHCDDIIHGEIREVSLIFDRVDRDEAYFPIIVDEDPKKDIKKEVNDEQLRNLR